MTRRFALLLCALSLAAAQENSARSLYERVGRYDAIAGIVDEYLKGVRGDPQFTRFTGRSADSLQRAKQLLKDQLCALSGGPCTYVGRDMKTAHGGLAISDAEWAISQKHMATALDRMRLPSPEKKEFLALVDSLRTQIVEKPAASR
jgi:hemoglobin